MTDPRKPFAAASPRRGSIVLLVLVLALLGGVGSARAADDGRVVFTRACDVWIAPVSGGPGTNLTAGTAGCETDPTLSRTGRYVAWTLITVANNRPTSTVLIHDLATRSTRTLAVAAGGAHPDFAPTSDELAFHRYDTTRKVADIYSVGIDGTGLRNWTNDVNGLAHGNYFPVWAPDGQSIVFTRSTGAPFCRVSRGGYDDLIVAQQLWRVSRTGARASLVAGQAFAVQGGADYRAYIRRPQPGTDANGYCSSEPVYDHTLVVNGRDVARSGPYTPSVSPDGDVLYTAGASIMVLPAGGAPRVVTTGTSPDWGVAYASAPDDGCTIRGTEGRDRLVGTPRDDVICGLGESDVILGLGGKDTLLGGDGEDDLAGGPGDDVLDGQGDDDALRGDEGADTLKGGAGKDLVTYFTAPRGVRVDLGARRAVAPGHGTDSLDAVEGAFGSRYADRLHGDRGSNHLFGGPGRDVVEGRGGLDLLHGTAGADTVRGGPGADLLYGDAGRDVLVGGGSRDVCYGGGGGGVRRSCEVATDTNTTTRTRGRTRPTDGGAVPSLRAGRQAATLYLGNDDYLVVYTAAATQTLGSWSGTSAWEAQACRVLRYTPARGACSAVGALQAVEKWQLRWFLWNARQNGGCAIVVLDYGRHGVNQFRKRWKARSATYHSYNVAIPWVTRGRWTDVKTSDSGEVNADYVRVTC